MSLIQSNFFQSNFFTNIEPASKETSPYLVGEGRDGAVMIPELGVICGLSLLLVLVLAPRGFPPGTPVLLSRQKPTCPNTISIFAEGHWFISFAVIFVPSV